MISIVWGVSLLWVIPITSWHYLANDGVRIVLPNECDAEYKHNLSFKIITALFNFYVPLAALICINTKIYLVIRKRYLNPIMQYTSGPCSKYRWEKRENSKPNLLSFQNNQEHALSSISNSNASEASKHLKAQNKKKVSTIYPHLENKLMFQKYDSKSTIPKSLSEFNLNSSIFVQVSTNSEKIHSHSLSDIYGKGSNINVADFVNDSRKPSSQLGIKKKEVAKAHNFVSRFKSGSLEIYRKKYLQSTDNKRNYKAKKHLSASKKPKVFNRDFISESSVVKKINLKNSNKNFSYLDKSSGIQN
jgi:hypothetical protein